MLHTANATIYQPCYTITIKMSFDIYLQFVLCINFVISLLAKQSLVRKHPNLGNECVCGRNKHLKHRCALSIEQRHFVGHFSWNTGRVFSTLTLITQSTLTVGAPTIGFNIKLQSNAIYQFSLFLAHFYILYRLFALKESTKVRTSTTEIRLRVRL